MKVYYSIQKRASQQERNQTDYFRKKDKVQFYYPIETNTMCLQCHGKQIKPEVQRQILKLYPNDLAFGYGENEVRGIWSITFEKKKKMNKKAIIITAIGVVIGLIAGYLYYQQIGCVSGTCAITSKPLNSTLYGGLMCGLLFNLFVTSPKKKD
nr:DUF6132 family protein [Flavobacterium piscinae]